jgi:hypothetical protein
LVVVRVLPAVMPVVGVITGSTVLLGGLVSAAARRAIVTAAHLRALANVPVKLWAEDVLSGPWLIANAILATFVPVEPVETVGPSRIVHVVPVEPVPRVKAWTLCHPRNVRPMSPVCVGLPAPVTATAVVPVPAVAAVPSAAVSMGDAVLTPVHSSYITTIDDAAGTVTVIDVGSDDPATFWNTAVFAEVESAALATALHPAGVASVPPAW